MFPVVYLKEIVFPLQKLKWNDIAFSENRIIWIIIETKIRNYIILFLIKYGMFFYTKVSG